jgi:uncharacterized protein DUF3592
MGTVIGRFLFSFAFAAIGLLLVIEWLGAFRKQRRLRRDGVITDGEVIGFEKSRDRSVAGPFFAPVVRFRERGVSPIEFCSTEYQRPSPYVIGQHVKVRYLPDDPSHGDIDGTQSGWSMLLIVAFFIVVCFTVASLPLVLAR